jgi:hypothetical protein
MHKFSRWAAVLAVVLVAGCTVAPIQNVNNAPVVSTAGKPLTQEQLRESILRAGAALGWDMKEAGPGKMVGTLALRTHTAVVDIGYSTTSYSINYQSSVNLQETNGKIHKNYNGWITNLNKGINTQLALL